MTGGRGLTFSKPAYQKSVSTWDIPSSKLATPSIVRLKQQKFISSFCMKNKRKQMKFTINNNENGNSNRAIYFMFYINIIFFLS